MLFSLCVAAHVQSNFSSNDETKQKNPQESHQRILKFGFFFWIAADKEVRGIDAAARTQPAKQDNFERILAFLATQKVRTSTVTSRDLASGNLKSLMRLILSLASHYKPHSVEKGQQRSGNFIFSKSISISNLM